MSKLLIIFWQPSPSLVSPRQQGNAHMSNRVFHNLIIINLLIIAFLTPTHVPAEEGFRYWGGAGILKGNSLMGAKIDLNVFKNRNGVIIDGYLAGYDRIVIFRDDAKNNQISEINSISIKYGYDLAPVNPSVNIFVKAGLSFNNIKWHGSLLKTDTTSTGGFFGSGDKNIYDDYTKNYIGLPLEAQILFAPVRYFGVGINGYVNMHTHPDYGVLLVLSFGKLKE